MIKRSAILLIFLALGSLALLMFTSSNSAAAISTQPIEGKPVKCSGGCNKKTTAPLPWNIISPTMLQHQG